MVWNSTSGLTGLEWFPTRKGGTLLSLPGDAAIAKKTSSVTQTVTGAGVYFEKVAGAPQFTLDFYAAANVPQSVTTATFRPNEDVVTTNWTRSSGVADYYTYVDEATLDTADFLSHSAQSEDKFEFRVASAAGVGAGRKITALRIVVVASGNFGEVGAGVRLSGFDYDGDYDTGVTKSGVGVLLRGFDGQPTLTFTHLVNPRTGVAWTDADIQLLDSTDEVYVAGISSVSVYQVYVEVEHVPAPLGSVLLTPTADGWKTGTLSSSFSKTNGTAYVAVLRKTNSAGRAVVSWADSGSTQIHGHTSYGASIVTESGLVTALGDVSTAALPLLFDISGTASVDSNPYPTLDREAVYSGRTLQQEFTPTTSPTIRYAKIIAARQGYTTGGDLLVAVKRRSDNVQIGGTWTITADHLPDSIRSLQVIEGTFASTGALVSGTQYYMEFTSTAPEDEGWEIAVLNSEAAPLTGDAAGYGSTTNAATIAGVESDDLDIPFVVGTGPNAPTLTATATADHIGLSWTDTGDTFHLYRDSTLIEETTALSFDDYRVRQGEQESYTVKAETDANGTLSLPSTAKTATMPATSYWRLVSNQRSDLNIAFQTTKTDGTTFDFLDDQETFLVYGRDHSTVEYGQEDRGERITVTAILVPTGGATTEGRSLFDDFLAMRDAVRSGAVTDLALLDPSGHRWDVAMSMPTGRSRWLRAGYLPLVFTTVIPELVS
jgi:hypothetical protein